MFGYVKLLTLLLLVVATGCRQPMGGQSVPAPWLGANNGWNPNGPVGGGLFGTTSPPTNPQYGLPPNVAQQQQLASQLESLNSRLSQFNSDNDNLHAQVAALQQRLQTSNSYNDTLRQQLADTVTQVQQLQIQNQQLVDNVRQQQAAQSQMAQLPRETPPTIPSVWQNASATGGASATIRSNNGMMQKLQTVQLPGFNSWMDGDVIRIEGPTDRLFVSGTWQINANDAATLNQLASAIRQNFPRQVVGVEAHWDGSPVQPATMSHHQLTATQALAVFDLLVKGGLSHDQVFTMALGSNRPRYPNAQVQGGISPNRRIEIVIYPESFTQ